MVIGKVIENAFNKQINEELYSEYLYLSMSAYFESLNLSGFAKWMREQAKEEREHAMKFFHNISERQGRIRLFQIKEPKFEWESLLDAFEAAYNHEKYITSKINELVGIASDEVDHVSLKLLDWFVEEQIEEEATAKEVVEKLKMIGENKEKLMILDKEMSKRGMPN